MKRRVLVLFVVLCLFCTVFSFAEYNIDDNQSLTNDVTVGGSNL